MEAKLKGIRGGSRILHSTVMCNFCGVIIVNLNEQKLKLSAQILLD